MSRYLLVAIAWVGCSAPAPPPPERPAPPAPIADAAVDAAPPPDAPDPAASAPPWRFRYHTTDRTETWTLQFADGHAVLVVENAQGTRRYTGTASDGASLAIDVTSANAKLALDCKHTKRSLGTACNDRKAKPVEVLDCYHPDFKTPMPFAPAPGVEYVHDASCNGYRLVSP